MSDAGVLKTLRNNRAEAVSEPRWTGLIV